MRTFLIVLTILVFLADAAVFVRFCIWMRRLKQNLGKPISKRQERTLSQMLTLNGILTGVLTVLVLIVLFTNPA